MKKNGLDIRYHPDGEVELVAPYVDGKLHGVVRRYHTNGRIFQEDEYVNGTPHGISRQWHPNGVLARVTTMHMGKRDGIEMSWYDNGLQSSELPYTNGTKDGIARRWNRNGVLVSQIPTKMGLPHGIASFWTEDGEFLGSYEMHNGTGTVMVWWENGALLSENEMREGRATGRHTKYHSDGTMREQRYYLENREVSEEKYLDACETDPTLPRYDDLKPRKARKKQPSAAAPSSDPDRAEPDGFIATMLKSRQSKEALSWLKQKKGRTLGELETNEESLELAQEIYDLGVVKITACEIEDYGAEGSSSKLILELPDDPEKRAAIFEWHAERSEMLGFDPEPDMGQRYLFTMLD